MVLGAGTLGLCVIAALRTLFLARALIAVAKHPDQRRFARQLGADQVVAPGEQRRAARRLTGSLALESSDGEIERLTGGVDVVFDCVGSAAIAAGLPRSGPAGRQDRPRRHAWHRAEWTSHRCGNVRSSCVGAYAYGVEERPEGTRSTFDLAFELVRDARLERLVSAHYPLERYEDAVAHAAAAGRRGAVKIVFDLRRAGPGATALAPLRSQGRHWPGQPRRRI